MELSISVREKKMREFELNFELISMNDTINWGFTKNLAQNKLEG